MATIQYGDHRVELSGSESVLDGLIRAGIDTPHSCRAGTCQSCLVRALSGTPPAEAQRGLKASFVQKGLFLACSAHPKQDLVVGPAAGDDVSVAGEVMAVEPLSESVSLVRVRLSSPFEFSAGQFVNLVRSDGLVRSYSVASLPNDQGELELHVRKIPDGRMSGWLCGGDAVGATIQVQGPAGDCFYMGGQDENLLLAGAGTGLAPLLGILRDAIAAGHRGRVVLYHGGVDERGLYLTEELGKLAAERAFFKYQPCVLRGNAADGLLVGSVDDVVLADYPAMADPRIYLCGDPDLVQKLQRKLYLAGAELSRIHADAFVSAPA